MLKRSLCCVAVCLLLVSLFTLAHGDESNSETASALAPPVRLLADRAVIDTGSVWGHSSPCVVDLDGDGLRDLVLGDFSGKFQYYRNVGTATAPIFHSGGLVQAGGADAAVNISCCIGAQARFCDLNGDGILDMISNSYYPGHCYLFRGLRGNQFAAREELSDKSGVPIRSAPLQQQDYQSFGSFYEPVDWDADGDFDLLIGCFDGGLKLRINEGDAQKHAFAVENQVVNADGEPIKVKEHLCPVARDWDGDGRWDIIAGSDDGSVTWFRNVGEKGSPKFAAGKTLVAPSKSDGYNLVRWSDEDVVPGIRSQVEVVDYDGDGKLDLLVGDFCTAYEFKSDLSEEQRQVAIELIAQNESSSREFRDAMEALREDFKKRYPGDEIYSDKAVKEWDKAYKTLREGPITKRMEANETVFVRQLRPYLADVRGPGDRNFDLAKAHGHVWLYLRK